MKTTYDAVVIGGGFYGACLSLRLRRAGARVVMIEMRSQLLERASYANQARVHNGYHYPRSFLTGIRSRVNFPRFVDEYNDCIDRAFDSYYAVARRMSNVTASQFQLFCRRIGAPLEPAPPAVRNLFDPDMIESVYRVREVAFNANLLRQRVVEELAREQVEARLGTEVVGLHRTSDGTVDVLCNSPGGSLVLTGSAVYNCTYARLNRILELAGAPAMPLKHEVAEIALVETQPVLSDIAITVMCGPFFSLMPFPPLGLHSLSHVRYTPHGSWTDGAGSDSRDAYRVLDDFPKRSHFGHMVRDAQRYVPALRDVRHVDSLWEIKTVLPRNEVDDGRPILLKRAHGWPELTCVMGSKIDNVYDMLDLLQSEPRLA